MTTYYCGRGGSDANSGRTWDTRLATLNGVEDRPVRPGDVAYIAPGVYRERLNCDVSGAAGSPITYIGDVTGEHTDGVGGPVRITGSDNDQTAVRSNAIAVSVRNYRIFRGFIFDLSGLQTVSGTGTNVTIEDCVFRDSMSNSNLDVTGAAQANWIIRRCAFLGGFQLNAIVFNHAGEVDDADHLVENCIIVGCLGDGINITRIGDITVRNCLIMGCRDDAIDVAVSPTAGHPTIVNNCIIMSCGGGTEAQAVGDLVENYNTYWQNVGDRVNVNVGANSVAYPPLFASPILQAGYGLESGFRLPWWFGSLSRWSQVRQVTGSNEPDEDLFGLRRPYTHGGPVASLCSWGPVQWEDFRRDTLRAHDGSLSARVKEKQRTHMFVPGVSATSHTISAWAWRTAGYTGHRNPEMVIKQPGQADRRTVAGGAAGAWVQVSDTFTPAAVPPWLTVELWNQCAFTTTTTVSTTSTSTLSTTSTSTVTVSTLTTTTTTLPCDVWWDDIQVS